MRGREREEGGREEEGGEGGRKVIKRSVYTCMSSLSCRSSTSQAGDHSSQHIITSSPVSPPSQQAHTHNDNKPSHERSQRVPATQVVVATDSVRADVDNIVLRAERELDPVEWNQDVHSGIGSNYHESNLLPDTADDMGPGN